MKDLYQRCLALAVAATLWLGKTLPGWLTYGIASLLARAVTPLWVIKERRTPPHRTSLRRNFRIAFGADLTERQIRDLTHRVLRHLLWLAVDFARLPKFRAAEFADAVSEEAAAAMHALTEEGKGVLAVGGHVGVFTLLGQVGGMLGLPLHTVSRPNRNPHLQRVLRSRQQIAGQRNIDNQNIARELLRVLRAKEWVGILIDENAKHSDLFLPFFGTQASVNDSIARFHLRLGAPILVLSVQRVSRCRYQLRLWGTIRHEPTDDTQADVRTVMAEITRLIEMSIRAAPEQWFWASRRWKTRPPGEVLDADGLPPRVRGEIELANDRVDAQVGVGS